METSNKRAYKLKTINSVLSKKFNDFLKSIDDNDVQTLVSQNSIITGGCIASMLTGNKVNDIDIYFTNKETVLAVAHYYLNKFKRGTEQLHEDGRKVLMEVTDIDDRVKIMIKSQGSASEEGTTSYAYFESRPPEEGADFVNSLTGSAGMEEFNPEMAENAINVVPADKQTAEKPAYRPVFISSNAVSLANSVQLILRFYGDAAKIHENFDFVHATNYWTSKEKKTIVSEKALLALMSRELVYIGSKYPIASLIRIRKFLKRDYTITAGQILKIAFQVSELNMKDVAVLEDQLTGVDVAYFQQIIDIMSKREEEGTAIDYTYIAALVDRLF